MCCVTLSVTVLAVDSHRCALKTLKMSIRADRTSVCFVPFICCTSIKLFKLAYKRPIRLRLEEGLKASLRPALTMLHVCSKD